MILSLSPNNPAVPASCFRLAPSRPPFRQQIVTDPGTVDAQAWNDLLARQHAPTPFMRREYLAALHASGSAVPETGWAPRFMLLWDGAALAAACPLYVKAHSYGEYVFDWAWANAYAEHGLRYYPKALVAVPFTPVPGSRLLARDAAARAALVRALLAWCTQHKLSSLHVLFGDDEDVAACAAADLMPRHQVQFHWKNLRPPRSPAARGALPPEGALAALGRPGGGSEHELGPYRDFEDFLAALTQDKRKKIRQERRKVAAAGVRFRSARGAAITPADWAFFYRCYERTYLEHGNEPYLTPAFFEAMARDLASHWVLFIAERAGQPIACSLIAVSADLAGVGGQNDSEMVAYGRYWGALERVDCLHFEACYYQPIDWCIRHGVARFEGGAQGEHKMARALLPVATTSCHWLAHPAFADAVARFLAREDQGMERYLHDLQERSPLRHASAPA
ncbi:GNAT family N-acetyltransferase [Ottowia pentelensis]